MKHRLHIFLIIISVLLLYKVEIFAQNQKQIDSLKKIITITQQDGGTLTTSFSIPQGTVTSVATAGSVSGLTLTGGTITTTGTVTLGGTLSLTSANVTTGLGFTPYNSYLLSSSDATAE